MVGGMLAPVIRGGLPPLITILGPYKVYGVDINIRIAIEIELKRLTRIYKAYSNCSIDHNVIPTAAYVDMLGIGNVQIW